MTFYSFYRNTVFIQRNDCIDWICIGNNKLQIWELRFNLRAVTVRCVRSSRPVVGDTVKGIIQNSIFKMPDIPMNMTVHAELNPLSCCSSFPDNLLQVVNISESARASIERLMRKITMGSVAERTSSRSHTSCCSPRYGRSVVSKYFPKL